MNEILAALRAMAQSFGRHFTALKSSIDELPEKLAIRKEIAEQTRILSLFATRFEQSAERLRELDVTVDFDTKAFSASLEKAARDIKAALPKATDLSNTEASLKLIYQAIQDSNGSLTQAVQDFTTAAKGISFSAPDTVRIDQQQVNQIAYSGAPVARRPVLTNTTIANASTEYSYSFPKGTVAWTFKLRDQGTLAYLSWKTGKLPGSGDSTLYFTVPQNFLRSIPDTDYSNLTLYFGAEAATTAELEVWTA